MKTLKVALLVTTTAGAVAAGGVTYATVGNSSPAPSAHAAKGVVKQVPAVKAPEAPALPSVPTCLPNLPQGAALDKAKASVEAQIKDLAAKAPATPVALPAAPGLPNVLSAAKLAKLPVDKLPTCKGDKKGPINPPHVPGNPG